MISIHFLEESVSGIYGINESDSSEMKKDLKIPGVDTSKGFASAKEVEDDYGKEDTEDFLQNSEQMKYEINKKYQNDPEKRDYYMKNFNKATDIASNHYEHKTED